MNRARGAAPPPRDPPANRADLIPNRQDALAAQPTVRGRYAPSPSGALHLGNLRTALLAWLFARHQHGAFVLRVEDLDRPRTRPGAALRMLHDLRWLGLDWDEGPGIGGLFGPYWQSQRLALYLAARARLASLGLLYPCYCTRAELTRIASAPQDVPDEPPPYPGTCRHLTARQQRERAAAGRSPAWRLRVPVETVRFHDALAGPIAQDIARTVGDFVIFRGGGVPSYQLAVVVDDALMGITQVVRGADLLTSTPRQLLLFDLLGWTRPARYAHVPLALDASGNRMAKRDSSQGLDVMRAQGITAPSLVGALAASVGLWPRGQPASPQDVLAAFDPARVLRDSSPITLSP